MRLKSCKIWARSEYSNPGGKDKASWDMLKFSISSSNTSKPPAASSGPRRVFRTHCLRGWVTGASFCPMVHFQDEIPYHCDHLGVGKCRGGPQSLIRPFHDHSWHFVHQQDRPREWERERGRFHPKPDQTCVLYFTNFWLAKVGPQSLFPGRQRQLSRLTCCLRSESWAPMPSTEVFALTAAMPFSPAIIFCVSHTSVRTGQMATKLLQQRRAASHRQPTTTCVKSFSNHPRKRLPGGRAQQALIRSSRAGLACKHLAKASRDGYTSCTYVAAWRMSLVALDKMCNKPAAGKADGKLKLTPSPSSGRNKSS